MSGNVGKRNFGTRRVPKFKVFLSKVYVLSSTLSFKVLR